MLLSRALLYLSTPFLLAQAQRFVRFISDDGQEYTGDAILPEGSFNAALSTSARVVEGDILGDDFNITEEVKNITQLLSPLDPERTRTVRCVGINYASHAGETNFTIPSFPILFYKPWTALAGPLDDVPVPPNYQNQTNFTSKMDYEAELVVVIGKKVFNISEDEALDAVAGYAAGYDVSHRGWQIERGGLPQPQFSMGKDADGWGPWGPALVHKSEIPDPQNLTIWAKVNGVTMQNATTADMIFGVKQVVSFFSMGITLLPGDIIFTGTPSGVQLGKADPVWLTDGDVVETGLDMLGTCTNKIVHTTIPPS